MKIRPNKNICVFPVSALKWELSQDSVAYLNRALPINLKWESKKQKQAKSLNFNHGKANHWNVKYRSLGPPFSMRSIWLIIPKDDVHPSNSLQEIGQNHWTMKYRSNRPTFIMRSKVGSHCLIIPKYGVHPSDSLQDIRRKSLDVK